MTKGQEWRSKAHHLPPRFYASPGVFFITVCSRNRSHTFGKVVGANVTHTDLGRLVEERWLALPQFYDDVSIDCHVVMPNHFHGILSTIPRNRAPTSAVRPLPRLVNAFKASVTRHARQLGLAGADSVWQSDYWDHIVRHERALERIREYIANNPLSWTIDEENSDRQETNEFYFWLKAYQEQMRKA
jgi:REP element-mobilizing transposase RayT